ncbi:MAG: NAD(P)H-hydrate dehydratase [Nakamurella sp.]
MQGVAALTGASHWQARGVIRAHSVLALREAEQHALARTPPGSLMQRASGAVATGALRLLGSRGTSVVGARVVLLVGPGNNGADALFAGARLRRRGARVDAVLTTPERTHPEALAALGRAGGRIRPIEQLASLLQSADLVIDGLLGIGAAPPLRGGIREVVAVLHRLRRERDAGPLGPMVLAVDVPTGVDPDTGAGDLTIRADLTVTFGAASTGLLVAPQSGTLWVVEIGLEPSTPPDAVSYEPEDLPSVVPEIGDDKFSSGVVGIHAGSPGYPGAAVLCTGAAVRARPSLVRFAGEQAPSVLARWPEVVAAATVEESGRVQAWVIGPGIGTGGAALADLDRVLAMPVPVLVDADALTVLATHPLLLARRVRAGGAPVVLTPHQREFARLFPDLDVQADGGPDRLTAARTAAARSGAVVLLKGHRTVIAAPDGRTAVNRTGSPWLASAGSGDVLSGLIGSILATGRDPFEAAALGALRHGLAGEAAERVGIAGAQALLDHL